MKHFYLIVFCMFATLANAQIINFPDANFKAMLLSSNWNNQIASDSSGGLVLDSNEDGEIEVSEVAMVSSLHLPSAGISDLSGLEHFVNLNYLVADSNNLTTFVSQNPNLYYAILDNNNLTSVDFSNSIQFLMEASLANNNITNFVMNGTGSTYPITVDLSNNPLTELDVVGHYYIVEVSNTLVTSLDFSNARVEELRFANNLNLNYINFKNGQHINGAILEYVNVPNLQYICADEGDTFYDIVPPTVQINSYCSFTPGGTFYTVSGNSKFDSTSNGCDISDPVYPSLKFNITNGSITGTAVSNSSGAFSVPVQNGNHTFTPVLENPSYFTVTPPSATISFPTAASPSTQNFCITPNGVHPDLEILIFGSGPASPGFDASYHVRIKNNGNQSHSGSFTVSFDDSISDFVSSTSGIALLGSGVLQGSFSSLAPFQTANHDFMININSPMETPAVNDGHIMNFTAAVDPSIIDDTPGNNAMTFEQVVTNSYDPNDKTCLQGATIPPTMVGEYVHYKIRFENTGTAPAQNIVVKDMIDTSKFDIATLIPIASSHAMVTRITNTNKVEFIFEGINLPFDDANNDGFIAFKIKTKPTLVLGDTFSNTASIYFDYNFPIVTNTETTTISALSNQDFEFDRYFTIFPNPAGEVLNITGDSIELRSISIFNMLGQQLIVIPNAQSVSSVDLSTLQSGTYFIKVTSDKGASATKFIKQ